MIDIDIQDQIYIIVAVFGAVSIILLLSLITLCCQISSLKRRLKKNNKINGENNYAYTNPQIVPGEELSRRGFSMNDGQLVPRIQTLHYDPYDSNRNIQNNNQTNQQPQRNRQDESVWDDVAKSNQLYPPNSPHSNGTSDGEQSAKSSGPPMKRPSQFNSNISYGVDGPSDTNPKPLFNNRAINSNY